MNYNFFLFHFFSFHALTPASPIYPHGQQERRQNMRIYSEAKGGEHLPLCLPSWYIYLGKYFLQVRRERQRGRKRERREEWGLNQVTSREGTTISTRKGTQKRTPFSEDLFEDAFLRPCERKCVKVYKWIFLMLCSWGFVRPDAIARVGFCGWVRRHLVVCVCFLFLFGLLFYVIFWGGLAACVYFWVLFPPEFRGREMRKCWLLDDVRLWWKGSLITQMCRINTCI